MMEIEFARKWVAALESGEYKQAIGGLRMNDSYCCLGVACAIDGMKAITVSRICPIKIYYFDGEDSFLPLRMQSRIGIDRTGTLSFLAKGLCGDYETSLASLNDAKFSFAQIADVIRYESGMNKE